MLDVSFKSEIFHAGKKPSSTRMAESRRRMIRTVRVVVVELEPCYLDAREVVVKSCIVEGPFGEPGGEE